MKCFNKLSITLALTAILISGCSGPNNPSPEDTVLSNKHQNRPDWVDGDSFYSEQGLSIRNNDSFSGTQISAFENKTPITSIFFAYDHADIRPQERAKLRSAIDALKSNLSSGLLIIGKCDWHGTEEYNLALGDRRANAVKSYLTELGADPDRIRTLSKGSLQATIGLTTEEAWRDRRSDVIVME